MYKVFRRDTWLNLLALKSSNQLCLAPNASNLAVCRIPSEMLIRLIFRMEQSKACNMSVEGYGSEWHGVVPSYWGWEQSHRYLSSGYVGDGWVFTSPNGQTHHPQFALYANEHYHAWWGIGFTESVALSSSTFVIDCVPTTNNSTM